MPTPLPADPVILLDSHPRRIDRIFDEPTKRRLEKLGRVLWHDGSPAAAEHIDKFLPQAIALIGQSPMDKVRLDRAPHLRAIFNVESNFLPNIDYAECERRGIPVLSTAPVYAQPVAELALAMAISLARRMHEADAAVRVGREFKGDNHDSFRVAFRGSRLAGRIAPSPNRSARRSIASGAAGSARKVAGSVCCKACQNSSGICRYRFCRANSCTADQSRPASWGCSCDQEVQKCSFRASRVSRYCTSRAASPL